jgi:hypothetical protein
VLLDTKHWNNRFFFVFKRIFLKEFLDFLLFFCPPGVGITVLSFRGHLQLGLMADKILIKSDEEAQMILDQMIEEIHLMGEIFH